MSTITKTTRALPTGAWQVDATHSQVEFAVNYMNGTFRGTFSPFEADLEVLEDGTATLTGSAKAADSSVHDENLSMHLQSPDFFDVEQTPDVGFRSTRIARTGDELEVSGELTIKGTTRPVTLTGTISDPITDSFGRERLGLGLAGRIDRTDFGLDWNTPLPTGEPALGNDVDVNAELFLIKG
jgi:polyisoprenoid-binding protein YceI